MTENERQEILKDIRDGYIDEWDNLVIDELFKQIEKEHTEIQALRALGTVDEFKALKKQDHDCIIKHLTGKCSYKDTGCSDCESKWEITKLIEKSVAKKTVGLYGNICPSCSWVVSHNNKYCERCGQKIDFT